MSHKFWTIVHHHRHGMTVWPVFQSEEPDLEAIAEDMGEDFEEERDEWLEVHGPFEVPS